VLKAISDEHLRVGRELIAADGLGRDGHLIGEVSFRQPKR